MSQKNDHHNENEDDTTHSEEQLELIDEAKKRFDLGKKAAREYVSQATEDLKFLNGEQWDLMAESERRSTGRPVVTVNKIKPMVAQVLNEIRKNRPAIQVDPKGSGSSIDTAKVIAGLIRDIEYDSNAEVAYDTATFYSVAAGIGYFRILSEYEDEESSEDQKLVIKPVVNPLSVVKDPNSVEADGSDMEYLFIVDNITHSKYEKTFPDSKLTAEKAANNSWGGMIDDSWIREDTIQIVEYFYKEHEKQKRYTVLDNETGERLVLERKPDDEKYYKIINTRDVMITKVKWCRFNGTEFLDEIELPGQYIPVIPVYGDTIFIDGKFKASGMVKDAKEAQRVFNYFRSVQAEVVTMAPRTPWVAEMRQVNDHIKDWTNANAGATGVLRYKAISESGQLLPPPQRTSLSTDISAISSTCNDAAADLKSITGMYDPSMGADSTEVSGKAILARQSQTNNANSHYGGNLVRSVKQLGRILVDIIPHYYDTPRMVRIVKPDDEQEIVAINQYDENGDTFDLTTGRYDVVIQTGPSYSTQRQEAVDAGLSLLQSQPSAFPLLGDLIIGNMDWAGSKTMSRRLKTQVPLEALEASGEMNEKDAVAKLAVTSSQLKQATKQLEAMNEHSKAVEMELKIAHEEAALNKIKDKSDLTKAEFDYKIKNRSLDLETKQTVGQMLLKEEDLKLRKEALAIKQEELRMQGIELAASMNDSNFDKASKHLDTVLGNSKINIADPDYSSSDMDIGSQMEASTAPSKPKHSPDS